MKGWRRERWVRPILGFAVHGKLRFPRVLRQGVLLKYTSTKSLPSHTFENGFVSLRKDHWTMRQHIRIGTSIRLTSKLERPPDRKSKPSSKCKVGSVWQMHLPKRRLPLDDPRQRRHAIACMTAAHAEVESDAWASALQVLHVKKKSNKNSLFLLHL